MDNERLPAALTHALSVPTLFVGPLVMYFALRRRASPWLRTHLDEAVNHHILVPVVAILLLIGGVLLNDRASTVSLVMLLVAVLILVASVLLSLWATIQAARGRSFRYPLDIKMVR